MGAAFISTAILLRFILMHLCINELKVCLEVTHSRAGGGSGGTETQLGLGQTLPKVHTAETYRSDRRHRCELSALRTG